MAKPASWADRFQFSISPTDRALLETRFSVHNPRLLPNLRKDIPADLNVEGVEFAYHVQASQTERHLWIRCCECERDHNHRRGLILRFADQSRATLGRDCGREKHSLDFDRLIDEFEGRMARGRLVRQAVSMLEQAPIVYNHLRRLRGEPTISSCLRVRNELARKLPEFSQRLEAATDGRVSAKVRVRDYDAERQRDARLDQKLEALARRRSRAREEPGVDRELLAELVAAGDSDASKEPIEKLETRVVHAFRGHEFFTVLPRYAYAAEILETQLLGVFSAFRGKASAQVTDRAIQSARTKFLSAVSATIKLIEQVEAAFSFTDTGNMEGIVRALNRFWKASDARRVALVGNVLYRANALDQPLVDIRLPPFGLNASMLRRIDNLIMDASAALPEAA